MNKTVRNERRKLTASYLNGIAIAVLAVGGFAPLANFAQTGGTGTASIVLFVICLLGSLALHYWARSQLGGMEE